MNETFHFSLLGRLRGVRYPLLVIFGLGALLALFQPGLSSWKLWAALLAISLMGVRVAQFLLEGRRPLILSDIGLTRSGRTVPFHSAQLDLRVMTRVGGVKVEEVVLWTPTDERGGRLGVGFDHSLVDFDRVVRAIFTKVPEMRIVVTAVDSADVRDERREAALAAYRPAPTDQSPAQQALAALGKPRLGPPPGGA